MATLMIEAIHTRSNAGWTVVLTGVDPTDHDFIVGTVDTPGMGIIPGRWNESGILRDRAPEGNINPSDPAVAELVALGKKLGAQ